MPKYFKTEISLPFAKERILLKELTADGLASLLKRNQGVVSLCVRFEGFEKDSLGYVFNIKQTRDVFEISDITRKKLLSVPSVEALVTMIRHVSGVEYDHNWQEIFQKRRNEITSER